MASEGKPSAGATVGEGEVVGEEEGEGDGLIVGVGVGVGVGAGVGVVWGVGVAVGVDVGAGVGEGVGVGAALTLNVPLIPFLSPPVVEIVAPVPAVPTTTEPVQTPAVKAVVLVGLIVPKEYVRVFVPV